MILWIEIKGVRLAVTLSQTYGGNDIMNLVNKSLLTTWRSFQPLCLVPVADHVLGEDFVPEAILVGIASWGTEGRGNR